MLLRPLLLHSKPTIQRPRCPALSSLGSDVVPCRSRWLKPAAKENSLIQYISNRGDRSVFLASTACVLIDRRGKGTDDRSHVWSVSSTGVDSDANGTGCRSRTQWLRRVPGQRRHRHPLHHHAAESTASFRIAFLRRLCPCRLRIASPGPATPLHYLMIQLLVKAADAVDPPNRLVV
jgi:hypothetical protein